MAERKKVHQPLPVYSWGEWDKSVEKVRAALRAHENGDFTAAAQLVDAMGRDDRVTGVFETRIQGLLGLPMELKAPDESARAKTVAEDVEARFWKMLPEAEVAELLGWGLKLGVGLGQIVIEREADVWKPRLRTWWPGYLYWQWDTRSFWVQTADGPVEVTPGVNGWVLYAPFGLERGWMQGALRRLAIPWLIRQWARRDWARYSEVHGLPARKAKYPQNVDKPEEKDRFFEEVANLSNEPTIGLPQGDDGKASFDFELVEAEANTYEGIERLLGHCDTSIAITVLGGNLGTEVKEGSRAAAQVQDEVRVDRRRFDAESLATALHDQVLEQFAAFNYGDPELAPYPCWQTEPPEDEKSKAETLNALGDGLTKLDAATANTEIEVDAEAVLEAFDVPTRKRTHKPEPAPAPEPAPKKAPGARAGLPQAQAEDDERNYADEIVDAAVRAGTKVMKPTVEAVLAKIEGATSFDELKAALPELLNALDAGELEELTKNAALLALLAGRHAVRQEA